MTFDDCAVAGARLVSPTPFADHRGRFMRAWCSREFAAAGIAFEPRQANMALSRRKGTLRGLHYQVEPALEAKLVRCTRGSVFDVVADVRPGSPTCGAWFGAELSAGNGRMLFVPEGCAHGCLSLEDESEILYMASVVYAPECVRGLRYDDPAFDIHWPAAVDSISEQDRQWPLFGEVPGRRST